MRYGVCFCSLDAILFHYGYSGCSSQIFLLSPGFAQHNYTFLLYLLAWWGINEDPTRKMLPCWKLSLSELGRNQFQPRFLRFRMQIFRLSVHDSYGGCNSWNWIDSVTPVVVIWIESVMPLPGTNADLPWLFTNLPRQDSLTLRFSSTHSTYAHNKICWFPNFQFLVLSYVWE